MVAASPTTPYSIRLMAGTAYEASCAFFEQTYSAAGSAYESSRTFFTQTHTACDEAINRVRNLNLAGIPQEWDRWVASGKKLINEMCQLTQIKLSFSDYMSQVAQGDFFPGASSFNMRGNRCHHFWDLAARVGAFGLLITAGLATYLSYKSIVACAKPLFQAHYFGPTFGSFVKFTLLSVSSVILPSIALHAGLLASDLRNLAEVLTLIDKPFEERAWYNAASRNKEVLLGNDTVVTILERLSGTSGKDKLEAWLTKKLKTEDTDQVFSTRVGRDEELKEQYRAYQESLMSLLVTEMAGELAFFGKFMKRFVQPHIDLLKKVNPVLEQVFDTEENHNARVKQLEYNLKQVIDGVSRVFTDCNALSNALSLVPYVAKVAKNHVIQAAQFVGPIGGLSLTISLIRGVLNFLAGPVREGWWGSGNVAAAISVRAGAPVLYSGFNTVFVIWHGTKEDQKSFAKWVNGLSLAHSIWNFVWTFSGIAIDERWGVSSGWQLGRTIVLIPAVATIAHTITDRHGAQIQCVASRVMAFTSRQCTRCTWSLAGRMQVWGITAAAFMSTNARKAKGRAVQAKQFVGANTNAVIGGAAATAVALLAIILPSLENHNARVKQSGIVIDESRGVSQEWQLGGTIVLIPAVATIAHTITSRHGAQIQRAALLIKATAEEKLEKGKEKCTRCTKSLAGRVQVLKGYAVQAKQFLGDNIKVVIGSASAVTAGLLALFLPLATAAASEITNNTNT